MLVILFTTTLTCSKDKLLIAPGMDLVAGAGNWTIDLCDEDKVLRICATKDISSGIISLLYTQGFSCILMNIYDTNRGIDDPVR